MTLAKDISTTIVPIAIKIFSGILAATAEYAADAAKSMWTNGQEGQ